MNKRRTHKIYLFCACVIIVAMVLAGCRIVEPVETGETEIRIPTETQPETVQTTQMPTEKPTEMPTETPTEMSAETERTDPNPDEASGFVHSYPLGTMAYYDLDGNGVPEIITANSQDYSDGQLTINGITVEYMAINPTGYFTIVNVDQSRDTLLVGISDYGFSDDDMTFLYAYDGAQITEIGAFEDILGQNAYNHPGAICHGDGTISARARMDILGSWMSMGLYRMDENGLADHTEFYRRMDWEGQLAGWEVTAKVEMAMYEDSSLDSPQVIVSPETLVRMTGVKPGSTEDHHWACFEVDALGATLWLPTQEVEWQTYVQTNNGFICSEEAFDGFFYAG